MKPKKQKPKQSQVSIRGETYAKLKAEATKQGIPVAHLLDMILTEKL